MSDPRFHRFLHRQIPLMIGLSVGPGLGYIFLARLHQIEGPALIWYGFILAMSLVGWRLHRDFTPDAMSDTRLERWYRGLTLYFYGFFALWGAIFLIYVGHHEANLHYIAIFTEIGAATVASALLFPDKRLYRPTVVALMVPLVIYFALIGQWYGYVLSLFAATLAGVLLYAANGSFKLLMETSHLAMRDQLTGLYNRHHFLTELQRTTNALAESGHHTHLLLIDLDHFKSVNDSLGHDLGDRLLQEVTTRLRGALDEGDLLARLGGDEFVVLRGESPEMWRSAEAAIGLGSRLLDALKETYVLQGHHLYISASIGVSPIGPGERDANTIIKRADIAMYEVKAAGRDGVILFDERMLERVEQQLEIERRLHFALEAGEFSLHFQPQLDGERRVVGAETLVRWESDTLGAVPPTRFIPIAEQTGLIIELGDYILEHALGTLGRWHHEGIELRQFSINISIRQLIHHSFVDTTRALLARHRPEGMATQIIFELTETVVADDIDQVVAVMRALRPLGIQFSMDDFGTGYSSLSFLKQLPIDEVKIDRAFIRRVTDDVDDQAMVVTILNIAKIFGHTVVAEGVEEIEQFELLRELRCELFQGYLFARPLAAEAFERFYRDHSEKRVARSA